jgi:hypothetical protein
MRKSWQPSWGDGRLTGPLLVPPEVPRQTGPDPSSEGKAWLQSFKGDNNSPDLPEDAQYSGHKVCCE